MCITFLSFVYGLLTYLIWYSINHSHLTVVFATVQHIPTLLALASKVPMLKMIVSIDDLQDEPKRILTAWGNVAKVEVTELRDCMCLSVEVKQREIT